MMKNRNPNLIRGMKDLEEKMKGKVVEIYSKLIDSDTIMIYRGIFRFRRDRYIFLTDVKVYKYHVSKNEKIELPQRYKYLLVKEDIIQAIYFETSETLFFE